MKRGILGIIFALALVAALSLALATPAGAIPSPVGGPNPTFATVDRATSTTPSAQISIGWERDTVSYSGTDAIHVTTSTATLDYASVTVPTNFILESATTISYWGYTVTGSNVRAPDEIFLFLDIDADGTFDITAGDVILTSHEPGPVASDWYDQWHDWTIDETTNQWHIVPGYTGVQLADYIGPGYTVLAIALTAGPSTTSGSVNVNVYFDQLIVNGVTLLDNDTGFIDVPQPLVGLPAPCIRDAVNAALPGDTVNVSAGTYNEQVVITKSLTLEGAGETTIIKPSSEAKLTSLYTLGTQAGAYWNDYKLASIINVSGVGVAGVTIKDLQVDGVNINSKPGGANYIVGISYGESGGTIDNATVVNMNTTPVTASDRTYGIWLDAVVTTVSVEVKECDINLYNKNGINSRGAALTVSIHDNIVTGPGDSPCVPNGILLINGAAGTVGPDNTIANHHFLPEEWTACGIATWEVDGVTIEGNTISNCDSGIGLSGNPGVSGTTNTIVQENTITGTTRGVYLECPATTNNTIISNDLSGNDYGIYLEGGATYYVGAGNVAHFNNITLNTEYGVFNNNPAVLFDATDNWWGTANGPTHAGNTFNVGAQGDAVSDHVDYVPWYDTDMTGTSFAPVNNTDTGGQFSSIQAAISDSGTLAGHTINVKLGTYDESVTINKNNLTLDGEVGSMPAITGGLKLDTNLAGLTLQNFYVTGTVDPAKNSVVRMYGAITDLTVDNCVFDGENVADRDGFSGGQIEGDLTVTNSEFKDILGWAVFDSKSGSGGDGSAMGTVTFAHNNIHNCNGSIVFRGLSTERTDAVNAYDNTWNNIGGNNGEQGKQWAALEVNRAIAADVYNNTVNGVALGEYGEGQAFQFWDIDTLKVYGNDITNNYQGVWIYSGSAFAVPGGYISFNNFVDNNQYGISVDPTVTGGVLNAENNWWGDKSGPGGIGPGTGDTVSTNVDYDPWIGASVTGSASEDLGTGDTLDAKDEADTDIIVNSGSATVTVAEYSSNPGTGFGGDTGKYVDVQLSNVVGVTEIEVRLYYTDAEIAGKIESTLAMRWWNGVTWVECSDCGVNTTDIAGPPAYSGYMWAKIRAAADLNPTIPTLEQLTGTPFGGGGSLTGGAGGGGGASPLPKVGSVSLIQYLDWQGKTRIDIKIRSDDGVVTLVVPQGTLMRDVEGKPLATLSVLALETPPPPPGYVLVGHAYNCLPAGANFAPNVTITFTYNKADIPDGVSEESLLLAYWDGNKWINLPTTINAAGNIATAKVEHFTPFALMAYTGLTHFSASGLSIQPQEVQPNEVVTISVSVANTGDAEGVYSVVLKVNGVKETEKSVTLAAGASQNVSFSVTRGEAASYSVDVNGLTGSFTVAAPAPPAEETPPASTPAPIAWWIWVIVGVIVVGLITFFTVRRRA